MDNKDAEAKEKIRIETQTITDGKNLNGIKDFSQRLDTVEQVRKSHWLELGLTIPTSVWSTFWIKSMKVF